jgi:hypothetical protein
MPASVATVIMVVASIAAAGFNDAAREQSTSEHQRDYRNGFATHCFLTSIAMLVAVRGRIPALLPPLMLLLRLGLMLTLTRLPTMLPAAWTAP